MTFFVLILWEKHKWCLISFGQFISFILDLKMMLVYAVSYYEPAHEILVLIT